MKGCKKWIESPETGQKAYTQGRKKDVLYKYKGLQNLYAQILAHIYVLIPHSRVSKEIQSMECFDHHSERWCKKTNPEFSRINGGGSISARSTCCIDLDMSSTEKGMLQY